ncbi:SAM-dependent methyltransferase [Catenuloplanes nepalensis]|uniref:SAM-dependent methyltransferase n=1 Tax=Catenuloplanes nepalensis TaxID=587533 RepID=A0ABT9MX05_9ACTN|nr:methyltransferase domain-containing protein [Catenuloplanes nepalensis]MDP9795919.1 SAM-dependent methyltransferase [Catenuloplanes nepalensis]
MDAAHLLADPALEASPVVANNAMNRLRGLRGPNSYARELGFDPVERLRTLPSVPSWLDLCCGSGRALIEAAAAFGDRDVTLIGVDLVEFFDRAPGDRPLLVAESVTRYAPGRTFDLITCVHGLHYVGDRLGVLARGASWLAEDGLLVADLDLAEVVTGDARALRRDLRAAGFEYDARRRRVVRRGPGAAPLPYRYLGADDRAGAGYTGQPSVASHYERIRTPSGASSPACGA